MAEQSSQLFPKESELVRKCELILKLTGEIDSLLEKPSRAWTQNETDKDLPGSATTTMVLQNTEFQRCIPNYARRR